MVYVSTTEFFPDEYSEGGPTLEGFDSADFTVDVGPAESFDWSLTGLINETTYYVALRAVDTAGTQSPLSEVQSATPQERYRRANLLVKRVVFAVFRRV